MTEQLSRAETGPPSHGLGNRGHAALESAVARLRADNEGLRTSQRHRAIIEQAKGVLMARTGCTPEQAFQQLVEHWQRRNQKLIRVAAGVVGATVTAPEPVAAQGGFELAGLLDLAGDAADGRGADRRLAGAALASALDLDELARTIALEAAADLGPDAVLLTALEPDGALRLVGGSGFGPQLMSAWQRIPPWSDIPLVAAARTCAPVLLETRAARLERFPTTEQIPHAFDAQASIPLQVEGRTVGVMGLSWQDKRAFTDHDEHLLVSIAGQVVGPFLNLLHADDEELPQVAVEVARTRWFRAAMDAMLVPLLTLTPRRGADGTITDFEVAFVNRAALAARGSAVGQIVGRTVLELYPRSAGRRLFEVFCEVLDTGAPVHFGRMEADEQVDGSPDQAAVELSVAPLGDGLLVSWRYLDA